MYENDLVLVFMTGILTTLAHVYKSVGWLKMYILLLPSWCSIETAVWGSWKSMCGCCSGNVDTFCMQSLFWQL